MTLTDELATALNALVNDLNGYKNCPSIRKMTTKPREVLARYDAAKAETAAADWLEDNYPLIRAEWEDSVGTVLHIWLQTRYPDVWVEYVRECGNV